MVEAGRGRPCDWRATCAARDGIDGDVSARVIRQYFFSNGSLATVAGNGSVPTLAAHGNGLPWRAAALSPRGLALQRGTVGSIDSICKVEGVG